MNVSFIKRRPYLKCSLSSRTHFISSFAARTKPGRQSIIAGIKLLKLLGGPGSTCVVVIVVCVVVVVVRQKTWRVPTEDSLQLLISVDRRFGKEAGRLADFICYLPRPSRGGQRCVITALCVCVSVHVCVAACLSVHLCLLWFCDGFL